MNQNNEPLEHHFFSMPPEAFHGKIPYIVSDLICELRQRQWYKVEGIFRLNGSDTVIKEIIADIDKGPIADWSKYPSIHDLAVTLKRYFRQMSEQEPITTHDAYECFVAAAETADQNLNILQSLVNLMPKIRRTIFAYLCKFLADTAEHFSENKMTADNLSICFAPNLICSPNIPIEDIQNQSLSVNKIFALFISHYDVAFKGVDISDPALFCTQEDLALLNAPPINVVHIQHQIFRCNFRRNHIVPYVPLCRLLTSSKFERPTSEPPKLGDEMQASLDNIMSSLRNGKLKKRLSTEQKSS